MSAQAKAMLLYRTILREHKNRLPIVMREMGNAYVKNEFSLHMKAKPEHLGQFYNAWEEYLDGLRMKGNNFGADINEQNLSQAQKDKMKELKEETRKVVTSKDVESN
jgi:hypothetical protein